MSIRTFVGFICIVLSSLIAYCITILMQDNGIKTGIGVYIAIAALIYIIISIISLVLLEYFDVN